MIAASLEESAESLKVQCYVQFAVLRRCIEGDVHIYVSASISEGVHYQQTAFSTSHSISTGTP